MRMKLTGPILLPMLPYKPIKTYLRFICVIAVSSFFMGACSVDSPPIVVEGAYMRQPAPSQSVVAAYMIIHNRTEQVQSLSLVSSPKASYAEIHRQYYADGMMQMRPVHRAKIPPQSSLSLVPNGYHIMLFELEGDYDVGTYLPLVLEFDSGLKLDVQVAVKAVH